MKVMFKRFASVLLAGALAVGFSAPTLAADSVQGVAVSGGDVQVFGIGKSALWVEKTTYSGQNALAIRYPSGVQTVLDNASHSLYAKAVSAFGSNAVATNLASGRVYDVSKIGSSACWQAGSVVGWPNVAQMDTLTGDGCAFYNAAKAASQ